MGAINSALDTIGLNIGQHTKVAEIISEGIIRQAQRIRTKDELVDAFIADLKGCDVSPEVDAPPELEADRLTSLCRKLCEDIELNGGESFGYDMAGRFFVDEECDISSFDEVLSTAKGIVSAKAHHLEEMQHRIGEIESLVDRNEQIEKAIQSLKDDHVISEDDPANDIREFLEKRPPLLTLLVKQMADFDTPHGSPDDLPKVPIDLKPIEVPVVSGRRGIWV